MCVGVAEGHGRKEDVVRRTKEDKEIKNDTRRRGMKERKEGK